LKQNWRLGLKKGVIDMAWVKMTPPIVPSLEHYPERYAKRFTDIEITELLTEHKKWVSDKMNELGIDDMRKAIEFGIERVSYPFWFWMPTDKHTWNAFHGKACYTLNEDYWQTTAETMMTVVLNRQKGRNGYGDCEDSSIFIAGMLRTLGVPTYVVLGEVYEGDELLGGHGYLVAKFPDDSWRLIESTLDTPPEWPNGYPVVDLSTNQWRVGRLTYVGFLRFDDAEYWEWHDDKQEEVFMGEEMGIRPFAKRLWEYIVKRKKEKRGRKKLKRIKGAWDELRG